jgi:hypothetical protein
MSTVIDGSASVTINSGAVLGITSGTVNAGGANPFNNTLSAVDFTGIPSWVKRITVMFQGVSTNSTSPPQIQIGAGSVTTSGYLGANAYIASSGSGFALFTTGFGIGVSTGGWGAGVVVHGAITLSLINTNTWVAAGSVGRSDAAVLYFTDGSIALGGALDRVRITTVNGTDTFDAGTINILYEG